MRSSLLFCDLIIYLTEVSILSLALVNSLATSTGAHPNNKNITSI